MAAYNIWGNVGNAAYAVPMVKLTPTDPNTAQLLGWNPVAQALDFVPFLVDPVTGNVNLSGSLTLQALGIISVGAFKVVGARRTGWTAATGIFTRTTFATSTVTLPQLAERVAALIDDLTAHGLIGA